jgi:predicted metalloprotease with PDZ domain
MPHRLETWIAVFAFWMMEMSVWDSVARAGDGVTTNASTVQYRLSFRQAETHRVDVELSLPSDGKPQIELMMPVWTPGSYLVREYSRQVESISALDGKTSQGLNIYKKNKNHWLVDCSGVDEVVVRYSLYCREMSVRTNWVEKDFAFLTGAATFLTRSDMLDHPHIVRFDALPNWPNIATSLRTLQPKDNWTRSAKNFDELVDSPIVMGTIDIQSVEVGGAKHYLATLGGESFWDTQAAVRDVAKIVEAEQALWGEVPYSEYWFLNLATESGGGLEHDNSCVLMTGRWTQRQKSKYTDWLGLVSHEFFHTWNVRRLRPKALKTYDYNQEQYFPELWVAEGVTSYYDDLFVARAGLCKPKEYLERLSKNIAAVQTGPGRLTQSLTDSSFDAWIKFYRPDENANNSRVNYYLKGALVGLLLDTEIRRVSQGSKSLDDVMRSLWARHRETGYTNEEFGKIVEETCGTSYDSWLAKALMSTEELDYHPFMEWFGLEWKARDGDKDAAGEKPLFGSTFFGVEIKPEQGKAMIDRVLRDSPASAAGLNAGDELIGIDGFRVVADGLNERLNVYKPGDVVPCLVSRRGKLLELTVKLDATPETTWTLVRIAKPTEEQETRWRQWLNLPAPAPEANKNESPAK